ncbi:hybrid sensor histidine kinase/response regulator transcription factor [Proteiniphilum sp. X52]|uniref:hybrid sensor histidine kinase/response regulator transcription factor n=1 Tax=Proteiniphilum sp. X52 TaxID=2382159 RepID=UPI000F09F47E|nr:hybrid sensor histidine kinase/response regulator transcription factor [Proteiniphilum sp. X52]RNC64115.1 hybrid sensor histidine kinase/response regulator [Proteiniphilum sp. X52]
MRTILSIFFLFSISCLKSFSIELNFKYYKVEDGLSSNTVYAVLQDSKGFMWFGTENGLNRFDGYTFTAYRNIPRNENSLVNNYVYCLIEDEDQTLWIGTERGVCTFDLGKEGFNPFILKTEKGTPVSGRIQNLISDNGKIWIASARQGVFVYENNKLFLHSFEKFKTNPDEQIWVTYIYKDKENIIWTSVDNTRHQIYKFDRKSGQFTPGFPNMPFNEQKELRAYSMLEDTFGTLWFGTWTNGLIAVDKHKGIITERHLHIPGKDRILHIHQLTEYDAGTLLIGSNDGLTSFKISPIAGNRPDQHFREPMLSNCFVYPIYKDNEGGLWIGTYYGGINYASPNRNYFTGYTYIKHENSVTGNVVSCFCEDPYGNIWIGTEDGGLNEMNVKTGKFHAYSYKDKTNGLSFDNVHALVIDNNNLWVGTYTGGLNVMDLHTKKIKHYVSVHADKNTLDANNIYSIYRDSLANIWIGTSSGINLYNRQSDNFTRVRLLNEIVMDILQTGNHIWFATINRGLQKLDLESGQWTEYLFESDDENSLISNDVICLGTDEKQQLWIGTNHGLCRYDPEKDIFIDEKMEFQSNYICKILAENENLWIATLKGLICYTPSTKQYRQFTKSDGLLSDLFTPNSGFKTSSGKIYIGTPNGFNTFYPKQIPKNTHVPPIAITDFQLFNKPVNMDNFITGNKHNQLVLTLAHNKNSFSFGFTALSFFAPEKNLYSFMLEGFDKSWNDAGKERRATYTNIPPGNYTFRVKASNNDGVWNDEGYALGVVVKPPLWWNGWSITLYMLFLITGILFLFHFLREKERRKNEEKIASIRSEQEKEMYRSKIEFFTNVAHEIRTPLSLIIAPAEQVIEASGAMPDTITENLDIIKSNSQRLLTLVNQLLDFSKIEKGCVQISLSWQNIHHLLVEIYKRFRPFVESKHIRFEYFSDDTDFETMADAENLTKVVSNLLGNASKYTTDLIVLRLQAHLAPDYYKISVTDNGIGLPESETGHIFKPFYQVSGQYNSGTGLGLYLVKSIVDAFEGKIETVNHPGEGFSISIILPKMNRQDEEHLPGDYFPETRLSHDIETEDDDSGEVCSGPNTGEKPSLLIVEDDADMQAFIRKQFLNDYLVYMANDGKEGLSVLENHPIDIIVTDMMMPNMDGIAFCKTVKRNFLWSHIPIIMLTAKTSVVSKIEAFEIGADAYLEKPFHMSYLSARIRNLLRSRQLLFQKFTQTPYATLKSIAGNKTDEDFLVKLNEIIERNIENSDFSIDDLAKEIGLSSSGLFAKIKQISGVTPNKLIQSMRLKKSAELLSEGRYRVNEVCYRVGFNNPSYFAKCFQKQFGKLPKDFISDLDPNEKTED